MGKVKVYSDLLSFTSPSLNVNRESVLASLPVYTRILDIDNEKLKDVIINHRNEFPISESSNVEAWHSSYKTHRINPHFQPYIDFILREIKDILFLKHERLAPTLYFRDFWAIMYENSDYTISHEHFPCPYAASYYVEAEVNCSPIQFDGVHTLKIIPQSGMLMVWPGILRHSVPPTNSKRTVLSMNLLVQLP